MKMNSQFSLDGMRNSYESVSGYENQFFRSSYQCFPQGVIGLFLSDTLLGGIGIWPMSPNAVKVLKSNSVKDESDFLPHYLADTPTSDWYLGGVLRSPDQMSRNWGMAIFQETMRYWLATLDARLVEPFSLWAIPVRSGIRNFIVCDGFVPEGRAMNNHPVMRKKFDNRRTLLDWLDFTLPRHFKNMLGESPF